MFGKRKESVVKKPYIESLSDDELKDHMFIGYTFKVVMTSGKEYTTPLYYIRGHHNDNFFLETIKLHNYCLAENNTDLGIELDTKYIESVEQIEMLKPIVIGEKAYLSLIDNHFRIPYISYCLESRMIELLEKDNNESLKHEIEL